MVIFCHELRRNKISLLLWSAVIAFMLGICVIIYPEMSTQMNDMTEMFADMGSFSAAFGLDQLNFGEFIGYFGIECGNVLGLGGAFFAALCGIGALSKEEKDHTAEFLLTHPVSRCRIISEKLMSVAVQVLILNLIVSAVAFLCAIIIGETNSMATMGLLLLGYFLLQLEIACITFGVSAFLRRGGLGIGLGIAVTFYFMNIIANLTEALELLKWFTPFGYADGANIVADKRLDAALLAVGAVFTAVGIAAAFRKYTKKDIV